MRLGPRRGGALLALVVVLQWIDTAPLRAAVRASQAGPAPFAIDPALLERAMAGKQEIDVLPSYACQTAIDGRAKEIAVQVQLQAARHNVATNTLYAGRAAVDCKRERARVTVLPGCIGEAGVLVCGVDGGGR
jgi:hypothetical protein